MKKPKKKNSALINVEMSIYDAKMIRYALVDLTFVYDRLYQIDKTLADSGINLPTKEELEEERLAHD